MLSFEELMKVHLRTASWLNVEQNFWKGSSFALFVSRLRLY